jgi:hypothetical protein
MSKSEVILKWWWAKSKDNSKHKKTEWPNIWKRFADSNLISKGSLSQRYLRRKIFEPMSSRRSLQEQMKRLKLLEGRLSF